MAHLCLIQPHPTTTTAHIRLIPPHPTIPMMTSPPLPRHIPPLPFEAHIDGDASVGSHRHVAHDDERGKDGRVDIDDEVPAKGDGHVVAGDGETT